MLLLDTDVLIDIDRKHPPALAWLTMSTDLDAAIPGVAALELLYGARSPKAAREIEAFIARFRTYWPTVADCQRALQTQAEARRSHGVGVTDMLIAQTVVGLGATLATFNTRHFEGVPALQLVQPYER